MRRQQQADERARLIGNGCAGAHGSREGRDLLQLGWQGPDNVDAPHQHVLAKLLDRQLGLTAGDEFGDRAAVAQFGLGVDLVRDPEAIEDLHRCTPLAAPVAGLV